MPSPLSRPSARWTALVLLSALIGGALELIGIPAAPLLGPMIAAILLAVQGARSTVPRLPFRAAQAAVGCLIAAAFRSEIVHDIAARWPLFLLTTVATMVVSVAMGMALARLKVLPGTVAIWGTMPGAAIAMVVMAGNYGADTRLVAVMSYTRVVCVAASASILAALIGAHGGGPAAHPFAPVDWTGFAITAAVALAGAVLGPLVRLPAASMLGPAILAGVLNATGVIHIVLPGWLLIASYAAIGWRIGGQFDRGVMETARRALPGILTSVAVLMLFCAGIAVALSRIAHVSLMTAYLATSPGGADSVAIIASASNVDVPFVMALQMLRLVAVLAAGPVVAKWAAERQGARASPEHPDTRSC